MAEIWLSVQRGGPDGYVADRWRTSTPGPPLPPLTYSLWLNRPIGAHPWMFRDGLLHQYYDEMLANDYHSYPACEFVDLLSYQNPSMKVVEVGANTGELTLRLLEKMSEDSKSNLLLLISQLRSLSTCELPDSCLLKAKAS